MKISVLIALFLANHCFAGTLDLGKGVAVNWPDASKLDVQFMGAELGYWLTNPEHGKTSDHFTILRTTDAIPVNEAISKLYWKQFLESEKKLGIKSDDKGCSSPAKGKTVCTRSAVTNTGRFIAEQHVWAGKTEMVMMRATSGESAEKAKSDLETLQLEVKP